MSLEKIQKLIDSQVEKKNYLDTILADYNSPKCSLDFRIGNLYLKIRDKSSIKFSILQNKDEIIKKYHQKFPDDILKII